MANVIFSPTRIEGLEGRYIDPRFFSGVVAGDEIYTDDEAIAEAYADQKIKVSPLPKEDAPDVREAIAEAYPEVDVDALIESLGQEPELKKDGTLNAKTVKAIEAVLAEG